MLLDEPGDFNGYTPKNASGKYYGRVSMRSALKSSLNLPAVRLLQEIGLPAASSYLSRFGITADGKDQNLSLALGSMAYGVTPTQLAAAYAVFASGGVYHEPYVISHIVDSAGNTVYAYDAQPVQAISSQNAFLMTSLLQTVTASGTGSKLRTLGFPVAGKTGTVSMTGGNRDIWMAAYTPEYAVVTWMGFDKTDSTHKIPNGTTGGGKTALLASAFLSKALEGRESPDFTQPEGLVWLTLDRRAMELTGNAMLASDMTPEKYRYGEVFLETNRPYEVSTVWNAPLPPTNFYITNAENGKPVLNFTAAQYARYRIVRESGNGASEQLTEMVLEAGNTATYTDESAPGRCDLYLSHHPNPRRTPSGRHVAGGTKRRAGRPGTSGPTKAFWAAYSTFLRPHRSRPPRRRSRRPCSGELMPDRPVQSTLCCTGRTGRPAIVRPRARLFAAQAFALPCGRSRRIAGAAARSRSIPAVRKRRSGYPPGT